MKVTHFDAGAPLILIRAEVKGPLKTLMIQLALDTGAEQTLVVPERRDFAEDPKTAA